MFGDHFGKRIFTSAIFLSKQCLFLVSLAAKIMFKALFTYSLGILNQSLPSSMATPLKENWARVTLAQGSLRRELPSVGSTRTRLPSSGRHIVKGWVISKNLLGIPASYSQSLRSCVLLGFASIHTFVGNRLAGWFRFNLPHSDLCSHILNLIFLGFSCVCCRPVITKDVALDMFGALPSAALPSSCYGGWRRNIHPEN